jgi:hypothetical protein
MHIPGRFARISTLGAGGVKVTAFGGKVARKMRYYSVHS